MLIAEKLRRRVRDEDGGIMIFIIMMFLTMIVIGGMAVDFMRHEAARSDLQNALDRGILAVTASSQKAIDKTKQEELEMLVGSYMASRSFKSAEMSLSVPVPTPEPGSTTRKFTASASYKLPTYFLKLIGYPTLLVRADSKAVEGYFDTEVALVLDVSSSMVTEGNGDRLDNLKIGAKAFVDNLLTEDKIDKTMISLVPFSGSVSLDPVMAAYYDVQADDYYNYSEMGPNEANQSVCVHYDFGNKNRDGGSWTGELGDFSTTHFMPITYSDIPDENGNPQLNENVRNFKRLHHFRLWRSRHNPNDASGCPRKNNAVFPFSSDKNKLNAHIEGLTAEQWTAAYIGIKWGTALLQPSSQVVLEGLANEGFGGVNSKFADGYWPRDISQADFAGTKKVLVVISDGQNTASHMVTEEEDYRKGNPRTASDDDDRDKLYTYWESRQGGFGYAINDYSDDTDGDGVTDGNMSMRAICDVAKASGIEIYAIAYEVQVATARTNLKYCASGSGEKSEHYFEGVSGAGLTDVFTKIAAGVSRLRLVN
ncbi:TadE/TadG family type IV pilus assembly protein [Halovulum sp. GXIMD14793]